MPEIRRDFLTGALVAISEERHGRPMFHTRGETDTSLEHCPFCPENSRMTPPDVYISDNKRVRVIPNKYPAFSPNSQAYGFHEVIIDTPDHHEKLKNFSHDNIFTVFSAIRQRLDHYAENPCVKYVQIIKNEGLNAGASIYHSHWQLFATDFVPDTQQKIHTNLYNYNKRINSCFLCDIQKDSGVLDICGDSSFFAYSPYASAYPHTVYIIPRDHISDFRHFNDEALMSLAHLTKKIIMALETINPNLSYNICFQNTPYNTENAIYTAGHFIIQLFPRIGNLAGFEFSTGCFINSVMPEKSRESLKKIIAQTS